MYNTESEKKLLVESIRRTADPESAAKSLKIILDKHTPIAFYIATADRSNCMWLFNPDSVYDMLGGEDIHRKIFKQIFKTEEEREQGVLCYVFTKTEKTVVVRLSRSTITEVISKIHP